MTCDGVADPSRIGEALRETFPDLGTIVPLRIIGSGFRSTAVETAGGVVFRIAKNRESAEGHAKEVRLLPQLQNRLPVAVPLPTWYAQQSPHFPFGLTGYVRLEGIPFLPALLPRADVRQIASDIASSLLALHRFPMDEAPGLPRHSDRWTELQALRETLLPPLRDALTPAEYHAVARWWDSFLTDKTMREYTPVLQHGDLWYENILVDDSLRGVTGILDWEHAAVGDPAQDFATQLHLGEPFARMVVESYMRAGGALDPGFEHRMPRLWQLREFGGIGFAVRFDDPIELEESIAKLRRGPVLNSS